jgi:hypothetical protein
MAGAEANGLNGGGDTAEGESDTADGEGDAAGGDCDVCDVWQLHTPRPLPHVAHVTGAVSGVTLAVSGVTLAVR